MEEMRKKLTAILETIAVPNDYRFDAITNLLKKRGIEYVVQEESYEHQTPIYEKAKEPVTVVKSKKNPMSIAKTSRSSKDKARKKSVLKKAQPLEESLTYQQKMRLLQFAIEEGIISDIAEAYLLDWEYILAAYNELYGDINAVDSDNEESAVEDDIAVDESAAMSLMGLYDMPLSLMGYDEDDVFLQGKESKRRGLYGAYGTYGAYGNYASYYQKPKIIGYDSWTSTVRNIVIPLSQYSKTENKKKVVFMAHYDAVDRSTGANDNGSGVAILIAFAEEVMKYGSPVPMEIVFTDQEECGAGGSTLYAQKCKDEILEVINLDTCGCGNDIITCDWSQHPSGVTWNLIYHEELQWLRPIFVKTLPYCDADNMRGYGFPVTGICALPPRDTQSIIMGKASYTDTYKYMHNGSRDDIKYINYGVLERIVDYLKLTLNVGRFSVVENMENSYSIWDAKTKSYVGSDGNIWTFDTPLEAVGALSMARLQVVDEGKVPDEFYAVPEEPKTQFGTYGSQYAYKDFEDFDN